MSLGASGMASSSIPKRAFCVHSSWSYKKAVARSAASGFIKFREAFLFLFGGPEVRLPSRRLPFLAWGGSNCLGLFFLRLLLLPIASLFTSGHVSLPWLTT